MTPYLQGVLYEHVVRVVEAPYLDLSTDPAEVSYIMHDTSNLLQIYRRTVNEEESRTGVMSQRPRELDGNQVLQSDETSRALYIQRE